MKNKYKVIRKESWFDDSMAVVHQVHAIKARFKNDQNIVAIHLLAPVTTSELDNAFESAERDGFDLIVVHTLRTWPKGRVS